MAEDGTLTATGGLSISDADANNAAVHFADVAATAGANGYGSFTLAAGSWTYTLDNASAAVQALNAGEVVSDTHTFTASDGTTQAVTVTITGTNDAPVIAGSFTGAVAEDGTLTATGALSISDADANNAAVHFADVAATAGANGYGSFTLAAGSWTYTLDNASAAVQALNAGEVVSDTHTFTASDGTTQAVTVTITGTNDAPVIAGSFTGRGGRGRHAHGHRRPVHQRRRCQQRQQCTSPTLPPRPEPTATAASRWPHGSWTYTLDNASAAVQALNAGQVVSDTHTFTASDGTTQAVTVTITGTNDAPVIAGQRSPARWPRTARSRPPAACPSATPMPTTPAVHFADVAATAGSQRLRQLHAGRRQLDLHPGQRQCGGAGAERRPGGQRHPHLHRQRRQPSRR